MNKIIFCMNCGNEHNKNDLIKVNNEYICKKCLEKSYTICNNCNSYVHKQYNYNDSCYNCTIEDNGFNL